MAIWTEYKELTFELIKEDSSVGLEGPSKPNLSSCEPHLHYQKTQDWILDTEFWSCKAEGSKEKNVRNNCWLGVLRERFFSNARN